MTKRVQGAHVAYACFRRLQIGWNPWWPLVFYIMIRVAHNKVKKGKSVPLKTSRRVFCPCSEAKVIRLLEIIKREADIGLLHFLLN